MDRVRLFAAEDSEAHRHRFRLLLAAPCFEGDAQSKGYKDKNLE